MCNVVRSHYYRRGLSEEQRTEDRSFSRTLSDVHSQTKWASLLISLFFGACVTRTQTQNKFSQHLRWSEILDPGLQDCHSKLWSYLEENWRPHLLFTMCGAISGLTFDLGLLTTTARFSFFPYLNTAVVRHGCIKNNHRLRLERPGIICRPVSSRQCRVLTCLCSTWKNAVKRERHWLVLFKFFSYAEDATCPGLLTEPHVSTEH